MKIRTRKKLANVLTYFVLLIAVCATITPLILMVSASLSLPTTSMGKGFKDEPEYSWVLPKNLHINNYRAVFKITNFIVYMRNSILVAGGTTCLSIIVAVIGGYALSRFRFRGRVFFSQALLAMYMFPPVLLLIPIFIILKTIGLFNSLFGLIFAYSTFSLPFCIWMLKGFFDSIPPELEEQAIVDGCTRLGSMVRILLPLSAPGITSTAIFSFILAWNEFMFANVLIRTDKWKTVTVGLPSFAGQHMTDVGIMFAASTLLVIPVLTFFFFLQKFMVRGLTAGAIKG